MATSILAWRISRTEEPGGLQSMGSQRVRQEVVTEHTSMQKHIYRFEDTSQEKITTKLSRMCVYIGIYLKNYTPMFHLIRVKVKWKLVSNSLRPHRLYSPWNSPGQNTGVGSRSLLQGLFWTQGSNPGLPHCRWILYQLSHRGRVIFR